MTESHSSKKEPIEGKIVDEDESKSGLPPIAYVLIAVGCAIYIINPTAGIFEFLPDNIPLIGNLDEASATAGLLYALSNLGMIPWSRSN